MPVLYGIYHPNVAAFIRADDGAAEYRHADTDCIGRLELLERDYSAPDMPDTWSSVATSEAQDSRPTCSHCGEPIAEISLTDEAQRAEDRDRADVPYFDRFDIAEAHYVFAVEYGDYARLTRLQRGPCKLKPSPFLRTYGYPHLTYNGRAAYWRQVARDEAQRPASEARDRARQVSAQFRATLEHATGQTWEEIKAEAEA